MIRAELMKDMHGERGSFRIGYFFSILNTVCYIVFQLSFCLSSFFLSDMRCLKEKKQLGGEGVRQMGGPWLNVLTEAPPWVCA